MSVEPRLLSTVLKSLGRSEEGPDDSELLQRFHANLDSSAFELLMWRHTGMVLRAASAVLRDHHEAEDVAQAVFLVLARKAGTIRNGRCLADWLCKTTRRAALRVLGKRKYSTSNDEVTRVAAPVHTPFEDPRVLEEVLKLQERYRLPIIMHFFEGLSQTETARRLGCSEGVIVGRIARAKRLLEKNLLRRNVTLAATFAFCAGVGSTTPRMLVVATCEAAVSFASGKGTIPGISPHVIQLASGVLRTMKFSMIRAFSTASLSLLIATSAVAYGLLPNATVPEIPVLAPAPDKGGISGEIVQKYEEAGAIYGGFSLKGSHLPVFEPGVDAARRGVPGFCWFRIPTQGLPESLPKLETPFGVQFVVPVSAKDIKWLLPMRSLGILILDQGLQGSQLDDVMEQAEWKNLQHLGVKTCSAGKNCPRLLEKFEDLISLELPPVCYATMEGEDPETFIPLKSDRRDHTFQLVRKLPRLRYLAITDSTELTEADCRILNQMDQLTSLKITSRQISPLLAKHPRLESIDCGAGNVIAHSPQGFPNLRHYRCSTHTTGMCRELTKLEKLETVILTGDGYTDEDVSELVKLKNLTNLELHSRHLSGDAIHEIATLTKLERLVLTTGRLRDWSMKDLGSLSRLRHLELRNSSRITAEGIKELTRIPDLETLVLHESDPKLLTAIDDFKQLKTFVWRGDLPDAEAEKLATLRKLSRVTIQGDLSNNAMTRIATLPALQSLELFSHKLTDDSVRPLANARGLTQLTLVSPKLTRGVVLDLQQLHSLQTLVLPETIATPETQNYFPRCQIHGKNLPAPNAGVD